MKNKSILISIMLMLISCKNDIENKVNISNGPLPLCPYGNENKLFKKYNKSQLNKISTCYDDSIDGLAAKDLIAAKAQWLKHYDGREASLQFLLEALNQLGSQKTIHLELANIYITNKNWAQAKIQIDLAQVEVNENIRLLIEGHLGEYSTGTDSKLLPHIFNEKEVKKAIVNRNDSSSFNLTRVSDGNTNTINGEPSMTTSADGQNIWIVWTDSGVSTDISGSDFHWWRLKSAQSTDGGLSWTEVDFNPLPEEIERFHFDPMTAYDENNNVIYAGGLLKGFDNVSGSSQDEDSIFIYKWHLDDDSITGPFFTPIDQPDKAWIAIDNDSNVVIPHTQGIEVSVDSGKSFFHAFDTIFFGAHPRIKDDNCLIITDIGKSINCDNNSITIHDINFSSLSFLKDKLNLVPGTFRIAPLIINAIHANGDIYVIYTDLKNPKSNDLTIYMAKSSNNGQTWSEPWRVSPEIAGDQFTPWMEIDGNGGLHIMYFDTRNGTESDTDSVATLDVYYSYSNDLGQTWKETRVTPTSLKTPELIWGDYFLTDYMSISVANDEVYLAFPWSQQEGEMHMYFAKKAMQTDEIFTNGFENIISNSAVFDDFNGTGELKNYVVNNPMSLPLVEQSNGRYRAELTNNDNNITLHYNDFQGRLDAKEVTFPFSAIVRNIGIGTLADSQTAPQVSGDPFTFAGIQVHVLNRESRNSSHVVVGHRGGDVPFTIEGKNTVNGVSQVNDQGINVVPDGRADICITGNPDRTLTVYWQQPNLNLQTQQDNWSLYRGTGELPGATPNYGSQVYVGLITYAFELSGIPFVGTADSFSIDDELICNTNN